MWGKKSGPPQMLRYQTIITFPTFRVGAKIYQIVLKRSMVVSADISAVLLRYFKSSGGNLIITIYTGVITC